MIERTTVSKLEAEPNFRALLDAYALESSIKGMPNYNANMQTYKQLEALGMLHCLAAYDSGVLVGFLCLLLTPNPHYSAIIATTESFFVAPESRSTGAGLALLREAEAMALDAGAVGMLVSAPHGGRLALVLAAMPSYSETNRVFFKELRRE